MATLELVPLSDIAYESIGSHLVRSVPIVSPGTTVAEVIELLQSQSFESVSDVAVCEGHKLVGLIGLERVLPAPAAMLVSELMDDDPAVVAPGTDQEVAAWKAVRHREGSLAVVDAEGNLRGLVPPYRLLGIVLWEHDEDLARLGGYVRDTQAAREASEEPVARRFIHRLPWLMVGLAGALVAASIVGSFEAELEKNVMLAFFMPGIVYLADAVGTQTEAIIIRGLSVGVPVRRVAWREVITGLLVGAALSLVFFPLGVFFWGEADVALAVSLSLFAACSTATVVAMALPALFHRLGFDPAFGSGPLATVIQDVLSIVIYLTIAIAITT